MKLRFIAGLLFLFLNPFRVEGSSPQPVQFFVVIPSYNNIAWCEKNLESVFFQTYQNWTIYYIDDCSTDGTGDRVEQYVNSRGMRDKCQIVHNKVRVGAMENLYNAIHAADSKSVVATLDGDDLFANVHVLQDLAEIYSDTEVWLTYGSYQFEPGGTRGGTCQPIPRVVLENASIRKFPGWITSQLRTFYAALFHKIKKEDLMVKGKFFEIAYDVAIMFPMIEMASPNHIRYVDKINYLYNYTNPLSDTNRREFQVSTEHYIRTLVPYKPLAQLFPDRDVTTCVVASGSEVIRSTTPP